MVSTSTTAHTRSSRRRTPNDARGGWRGLKLGRGLPIHTRSSSDRPLGGHDGRRPHVPGIGSAVPPGHPQRLRRPGLRGAAEGARHPSTRSSSSTPRTCRTARSRSTDRDITTNLPYVPGAHLAFDHHLSERRVRNGQAATTTSSTPTRRRRRAWSTTTTAAQQRFPRISDGHDGGGRQGRLGAIHARGILHPEGWVLLNYLMDPRTGLGRFRDFRISQLPADDGPDRRLPRPQHRRDPRAARRAGARRAVLRARGRTPRSRSSAARRSTAISSCSTCATKRRSTPQPLHDLRAVPRGQHLDPRAVGPASSRTRCSPSASRSSTAVSKTNVGELMLEYGGGGHEAAGTCQVDNDGASTVLAELVEQVAAG